jgi:hypothetical protein
MKLPALSEYVYPGVFTLYTGHGRDKLYRLIKDGKTRRLIPLTQVLLYVVSEAGRA